MWRAIDTDDEEYTWRPDVLISSRRREMIFLRSDQCLQERKLGVRPSADSYGVVSG